MYSTVHSNLMKITSLDLSLDIGTTLVLFVTVSQY